jgi:hypothetical protein
MELIATLVLLNACLYWGKRVSWPAFYFLLLLLNVVVVHMLTRQQEGGGWDWPALFSPVLGGGGGGGAAGAAVVMGHPTAANAAAGTGAVEPVATAGGLLASVARRVSGQGPSLPSVVGLTEEGVQALREQLPPIGACLCACVFGLCVWVLVGGG